MQAIFNFLHNLFLSDMVQPEKGSIGEAYCSRLATLFTGAFIMAVVMTVVVLVFIITVAVLAVKNNNKKNKLKDSSQVLEDNAELRNRIRTEIEPYVRK